MIQLLYSIWLGFWRRWFGGGLDFLGDNRFIQHIVGFISCGCVLWLNNYNMFQIIIGSSIFQGLFWARSHGCCYDLGHGSIDTSRYEELWYWKYIKKFIPENEWYTKSCDFILLTIRYTLPSLLLAILLLLPQFLVAGLVVSSTYLFMWTLYDYKLTKDPTEISEYLSGFFIGLLLTL